MLASPIYMMQVFQRVLTSGHTSTLLFLTIIALFAIAMLGALEAVRSWSLNRISSWLGATVSPALIESSVSVSLAGAGRGGQALRDLGAIQQFVGGQGVTALMDSPWVPIFVAVIWLIHPILGMLALGAAVVLFALALLNELLTKRPLTDGNRFQMAAQQFVDSSLRNAEIVQAMGMLPSLIARWRAHNEEAGRHQLVAGDRSGAISGFTKFFRLAVQVCILGAGCLLVLAGELGPGQMIATSILLSRALSPVEQSIGAWRNFTAARNAHSRLEELLRMAPPSTGDAMKLPEPKGQVIADKVTFFPGNSEHPTLRTVSLALEPGETLGILGPSGAGKSTLCRLMVGVWKPQSGSIRLDSAEIHSWDRTDFGRYVGYLPQDVELFDGTIRENIARMGQAPDEDVIEAAQLAGVHDMILHFPDGYDTVIGPAGVNLSGGQRQRVGLARALFGRPRLLVLDEPNASLDQQGESALANAIRNMKGLGTTIILVGHRMAEIRETDKLLFLREGRVELFGPRLQVLEKLKEAANAAASAQQRNGAAKVAAVSFGERMTAQKDG